MLKTAFAISSLFLASAQFAVALVPPPVVTFEDQGLAADSYKNGGPATNSNGFYSGGVHFENEYSSDFGGYWSGFSTSTTTDTTTNSFTNPYSAIPGGGAAGSSAYAVGFAFQPIVVSLPVPTTVQSVAITNTTLAALTIKNGGDFDAKKFGGTTGNDPDTFLLTINGYDPNGASTGSVDFYLADYRFDDNAQDYVVTNWQNVDLTSLGSDVQTLTFGLATTDNGDFGPNTPLYFAIDNLTVAAVPEPASIALLSLVGGALLRRRR